MELKYILETPNGVEGHQDRPKQADIRDRGVGEYHLRRPDGSLIKRFTVEMNRRGNPQLTAHTPTGLDGAKTLHLDRMLRAYATIVKYWPAKERDENAINHEKAKRDELIRQATDRKLQEFWNRVGGGTVRRKVEAQS